jgi:hypothetical protein
LYATLGATFAFSGFDADYGFLGGLRGKAFLFLPVLGDLGGEALIIVHSPALISGFNPDF